MSQIGITYIPIRIDRPLFLTTGGAFPHQCLNTSLAHVSSRIVPATAHNLSTRVPQQHPMPPPIVLASSSETRLRLLRAAGLPVSAQAARIDEEAARSALEAEGATPRDIADTLAEMKARKIAEKTPGAIVLGCDQVLDFKGRAWGKSATESAARDQLRALRGNTHRLLSAVVLYHDGRPQWRHIGEATLTMRTFSDDWLEGYLSRNWSDLRHSAGGYLLEAEGVRLFEQVEGDYFSILGLPLLPLLGYLGQRGFIPT